MATVEPTEPPMEEYQPQEPMDRDNAENNNVMMDHDDMADICGIILWISHLLILIP